MSGRLHSHSHHHLGLFHMMEGAFLTSGMLLATLGTLVAVYVAVLLLER